METIEKAILDLQADLTKKFALQEAEIKSTGQVTTETKDSITALIARMDEFDVKIATRNTQQANDQKSILDIFKENESMQRLMKDKRGSGHISLDAKTLFNLMERKTTITESAVGFPTSGVMPEERGQMVIEARRAFRMRDVIPVRPTTFGKVYWPKVNLPMTKASPIAETVAKPENRETFTTVAEDIKTIATWIPASRQVLDDWSELLGILRSALGYQVDKEEDLQILSGDNTGENLNGLTTQATAWDLALMTASDGYEYVDIIAGAAQQIAEADEIGPTFVVLHPRDWWKIKRGKDTQGRYILGDPASPFDGTIWGLRPVVTTAMSTGHFLVGAGYAQGAEIRERMGLEIEISTEHSDYFTTNMVAIRAEKRSALCVYRPAAYIYGSLTQSPA